VRARTPSRARTTTTFLGVSDFIDEQIKTALEKHAEWKEKTEENEKTS